ncbi:MAG: CRTAC1 family protein [Chthonomonadales bacterium]
MLCLLLMGCGHSVDRAASPHAPANPGVPASIGFHDVSREAGVLFQWPPLPHPATIRDIFGYGCAFADFDGDGRQDILLVAEPHPLLYQNLGRGSFLDVTHAVGLDRLSGAWTGCAVGDVDGDGFPDLLLTGFHRLALLHNAGGTRFADCTVAAGLDPHNHGHWGASAGFIPLHDADHLDLVLTNYVRYGPQDPKLCEILPGIRTACPPSAYHGERGELWQNVGGERFREVSPSRCMALTSGKELVVAFADVDGTGRMSFYIGNDGEPADLMLNLGGLRFRNAAKERGIAYAASGKAMAAMSADWADFNRDGRPDLLVTNFSDEPYAIFQGGSHGLFTDVAADTGIAEPTRKPLGFGAKWLDVDNDGWPDFAVANGHVYDAAEKMDPLQTFRQPMMLFYNRGGRDFVDLAPLLGGDLAQPRLGRGMAAGDFDDDGRMDLLVVNLEGRALLLHNDTPPHNHWITLDLRSRQAGNRFAYGAQVQATAGGQLFIGQVSPASAYLSSSDRRIHFGLGSRTRVDRLVIRWPDGKLQEARDLAADAIWRVEEGRSPRRVAP